MGEKLYPSLANWMTHSKMDSPLKLSEAIKLGHAPTTEKLLNEALARFVNVLAEEYELQREHIRYNPSGQTREEDI